MTPSLHSLDPFYQQAQHLLAATNLHYPIPPPVSGLSPIAGVVPGTALRFPQHEATSLAPLPLGFPFRSGSVLTKSNRAGLQGAAEAQGAAFKPAPRAVSVGHEVAGPILPSLTRGSLRSSPLSSRC